MKNITRETIIEAAKEAAKQVTGPLSRSDFVRITGVSEHQVYKIFPEGGWSEVKQMAGLAFHPQGKPLSDDDLLKEFHRIASTLGNIPTWRVFSDRANISADVVRKRFGGTKGTRQKYINWLKINHPDSSLLSRIKVKEKSPASFKEVPTAKLSS